MLIPVRICWSCHISVSAVTINGGPWSWEIRLRGGMHLERQSKGQKARKGHYRVAVQELPADYGRLAFPEKRLLYNEGCRHRNGEDGCDDKGEDNTGTCNAGIAGRSRGSIGAVCIRPKHRNKENIIASCGTTLSGMTFCGIISRRITSRG